MTTLETLQAARSLIANGWTKNQAARTADLRPTTPRAYDAVNFCAAGALMAMDGENSLETGGELLIKGLPAPTSPLNADTITSYFRLDRIRVLTNFNDHPRTTQNDVLALYDRAIERLT